MENQAGTAILSKTLSIIIAILILGAIATFIYTITAAPKEKFTEFYILNTDGKAMDYPTQLRLGEKAELILGIGNQEQNTTSYRVEIKMDGVTDVELGPIELMPGEKYEQVVTFTPDKAGEDQRVDFLLYKQGQSEAYRTLHLWVNVKRRD